MTRTGVDLATWETARSSILRLAQRHAGVTGVDYGYLYRNGVRTRRRGVRFHVQTKLPVEELAATQVLPSTIAGLPCDVLQAAYSPSASPQGPCHPLQLGVSIGNLDQDSTGTLGLLVRDRLSGKAAILSNWHVLCGSTQARVGNVLVQPGPRHMGSGAPRPVAQLERWLPPSTGLDAAIGLLEPGVLWEQALFGGLIAVKGVVSPRLGMKLAKFGAMSNLTQGVVDGARGAYVIDYSACGDGVRAMDGVRLTRDVQSPTDEISLEGDSGAVWVDRSGRAAALHFAGEDGRGPTAEYALAHPIERVFALLHVEPL
jgi:hypothetical protein